VEKFYFPRFINEPLGLEYLAAYLRNDHQVEILDAVAQGWNKYWLVEENPEMIYQGLNLKEIIKKINQSQPEVIGITWLFSTQNDCVNATIKAIKQTNKKIITVVGGPYPSANSKQILKDNHHLDIVIYGEGEITFKELLDKEIKDLENIQGIAFRENGQIKINPPRPLIENLDKLPLPARDLVPYQNYAKQNLYAFIYNRLNRWGINPQKNKSLTDKLSSLPFLEKFYYQLHNQKRKNDLLPKADIVSSRGCPNHCTFCAIHNIWQHKWRMHSAENVLQEIDWLVNNYGIRHINFQDDNFNASKKRTIEICQGLIKRKYNLTILAPAGAFIPTLDEEILTWLKKAGLNNLRMSIESGNQEILNKIIKKRIDLNQIKPIVQICKKLGIKTEGAFMFGIPGETIQTMQDTLNFARKMKFDRIKKFIFQPFPNTELYDICVKNNYLTKDYDPRKIYVTGNKCYVKTEEFSPEDVIKIARN